MEPTGQDVALSQLPELLPGEDRTFGSGLFVDLIPRSCWFTNVRTCVDARDWDRLRRMVYARAGHCCEACGVDKDQTRQLEAHERWEYRADSVQALRRLVCLCADCHIATHFGFAARRGRGAAAAQHLQRVNGWSPGQTKTHIGEAFAVWKERSERNWTLDLGILTTAGVRLQPVPSPAVRAATPGRRLR